MTTDTQTTSGSGTGDPTSGAQSTIRVLIVDDHQMVTTAFARVVTSEPDMEPVGVAHDVDDALQLCRRHRPDVVLMDYGLPSGDGVSCAAAMKQLDDPPHVLILTGGCDTEDIARAVHEGCDGLLLKTASSDELTDAIRRVAQGEVVFSAADLTRILRSSGEKPKTFDLSKREHDVLQCLAEGLSTTEIGATLYISIHTVRSHVRRILEKLDAHSKLEAVVVARRNALVS